MYLCTSYTLCNVLYLALMNSKHLNCTWMKYKVYFVSHAFTFVDIIDGTTFIKCQNIMLYIIQSHAIKLPKPVDFSCIMSCLILSTVVNKDTNYFHHT